MNERDISQPTEHERRVAEKIPEVEERPGDAGPPSYAAEIEAEHRGITGEEVEEEGGESGESGEEDRTPLDSAYRPRSG